MKIFNIKPITVTEYIFKEEHFTKSLTDSSYESGFNIDGEVIESLNTLIITFHILYTVDDETSRFIEYTNDPNTYSIHIEGEMFSGEIFLSYKSSCQFNFESEGFDADVLSITEFLAEYCTHTREFMKQYGFKPIAKKEEGIRMYQTVKADALLAIDNLRANNMYKF